MQTVNTNSLYLVSWLDPASGPDADKKQVGMSRSAFATIGQDNLERIFILEIWAGRIAPDKLIDKFFATQEKWRPAAFGLDATGPQKMFAQIIHKEIQQRAVKMNFRPSDLKNDKGFAIETTLQPVAASGRLFRPPENDVRGLKDEWQAFPDGMYRDTLDALACAIRLLPSILPDHMKRMGRDQLRNYLARTGLSREEIERRLSLHQEVLKEEGIYR